MIFLSLVVKEQDKELLESLYSKYREKMYASALTLLGSDLDAEDAVQEVFMSIAKGVQDKSFDLPEAEEQQRSYLISSVRHAAAGILRLRARDSTLTDKLEQIAVLSGTSEDPAELICEKYSHGPVVEALIRIGEPYLSAIYFHIGVGMSVSQTAKLLGRTPSALKQQLVRGKKLLRSQLKEMEGEQNND